MSFADVVAGRIPPSRFRGKVVLIGATAPVLQDVHPTALRSHSPLSGVEIQAQQAATALRDFPLRFAPRWLDRFLILLVGVAVPLATLALSPRRALAVALPIAFLYALAAQLAFDAGTVLTVFYPLAGLLLATGGAVLLDLGLTRSRVAPRAGRRAS